MIGLIAAMTSERNALLRYLQGWKKVKKGDLRGIHFELAGKACILVTSGMGVERARTASLKLIQSFAPQWLISFGIAGAVEDNLQIGDVIAIRAVCQLHEQTLSALRPLHCWPDEGMQLVRTELAALNARLLTGVAITTNGSQPASNLLVEMEHPILEMETAGIAQVAEEHGIAFSALRAISDGPGAPLPFDLGVMMDEHGNLRARQLLMKLLRHPGIALKFPQMQRNAGIAADRAAKALVALIKQEALA
jgi:adenosylhomocysteine nucleosidase